MTEPCAQEKRISKMEEALENFEESVKELKTNLAANTAALTALNLTLADTKGRVNGLDKYRERASTAFEKGLFMFFGLVLSLLGGLAMKLLGV